MQGALVIGQNQTPVEFRPPQSHRNTIVLANRKFAPPMAAVRSGRETPIVGLLGLCVTGKYTILCLAVTGEKLRVVESAFSVRPHGTVRLTCRSRRGFIGILGNGTQFNLGSIRFDVVSGSRTGERPDCGSGEQSKRRAVKRHPSCLPLPKLRADFHHALADAFNCSSSRRATNGQALAASLGQDAMRTSHLYTKTGNP
jgi:hypothetical protein